MTEKDPLKKQEALSANEINPDSPFTLPGFFQSLSEGQLVAGRCQECNKLLVPPRPACYACGSRIIDVEAQPKTGNVFSFTEVRKPSHAFADIAPFTVAIVELDSGAQLTGRVKASYEDIEIGTSVRLVIQEPSEEEKKFALSYENDWPLHLFEPLE